ncbi:carboxypeptidase-like regulatory domain-containing protein [Pedobacter sp. KBS0701]|uniref:carboxypeptidase-like regulatory domain-containing protein n=1 Tax=Pedobacter sp. KBS0701 TaxID=2578106 RepID=UPI00110EAB98|nr:carboxypeptidase-like regulatory domain-containing protein [Pedobacter sp. KBS0701]QDW23871.1 carboxypeptidase-like regulatory domain-containing protein [Pedobacter sp. KBS0701]
MPSKFKIQIAKPCHEEWESMQPNVNGKFCGSCQKAVTDFTHFTDEALKHWFNENQGSSCGRFKPEQLDRLINVKESYTFSRFKPSLITASLIAFLSFPKLANANISLSYPTFQTDNIKSLKEVILERSCEDGFVTVQGKVIDGDNKLPIIGAAIMIKGSKIRTVTDRNGKFEFRLNRKEFKNNIFLDLRYIGYEIKHVKVKLEKDKVVFIKMKMDSYVLGGLAIIKQPTFLERISQLLNG